VRLKICSSKIKAEQAKSRRCTCLFVVVLPLFSALLHLSPCLQLTPLSLPYCLLPAAVPQMLPLLYEHFRLEGVTSEMFLMDWMMSLFTKVGCY
jgi:hypothetical protein